MSTMLRLYEHVDDYQTVLEWIEEHAEAIAAAGGELPPELEELLDQVEGDLQTKVERTALVVQNLLANANAARTEAERIAKHAASYERQAGVLKQYLHEQLVRAGVPRIDGARVKVRIQRNSRPTIEPVGDEIPARFQRTRVEFDAQGAYDAVKPLLGKDAPDEFEVEGLRVRYGVHLRVW